MQRLSRDRDTGQRVEGERSLVVVRAIIGSLDMNPTNSLDTFSLLVLIQMMRSPCGAPCGLQQGIIWTSPVMGLVEEDVEGLLIDSCLWELHLGEMQSVTLFRYLNNTLYLNTHKEANISLDWEYYKHIFTFVCFFSVA